MPWAHRHYGELQDPIHKSHLNALVSDFGCPRAFKYARDAEVDGKPDAEANTVSGYMAAGTATHETIARALTTAAFADRLLVGEPVRPDHVKRAYFEEWERETDGREVRWRDKDEPDELHEDRVSMITGLLNDVHKYVARIELVEAGFIVPVGRFWLSGHIDLVYRPKSNPRALAITDWKTGATKPLDIELDHGWEAGVYSAAVHAGLFVPREAIKCTPFEGRTRAQCGRHNVVHASRYVAEREVLERTLIDVGATQVPELAEAAARYTAGLDLRAFREYPAEIYHVHLADYVPYEKAGRKQVKRPEDLRFYGYDSPRSHGYQRGELRGPAWLPVRVTEQDIPRLESRLRNVVGMVRMGRFIDQVGEKCRRCAWAGDCLSTGYAPRGDERDGLERTLRASVAAEADAAELSLD
jgi:hypothetical protein